MASLRKKYQAQIVSPERDDGPPVLSPPVTGANMPDLVESEPIEQPEAKSPAEQAEKQEIQRRLEEMNRAEQMTREATQQQARFAEEPQEPQQPQDPLAHLPPRVQRWYREHPELATDPERAAQVQYCHHVARRETGGEFTDPYFDRMEAMLFGTNGQVESRPTPQQANRAPAQVSAPPREPMRAPPRQYSAPVSAPPTRE